jgi:cytidylate kinase
MIHMEPTPASVGRFADLAALLLGGDGDPPAGVVPVVVAVDGASGAGKTRWAECLASAAGVPMISLDEIYPGWDGLQAVTRTLRRQVLEPVAAGLPARYQRWDWDAGRYDGPWHTVRADRGLVVEGVGSGARAVADLVTSLVWVEAPLELRYARAMARDGEGYRPHWDRWAAQERVYLDADRPRLRADLVVDGAFTSADPALTRLLGRPTPPRARPPAAP